MPAGPSSLPTILRKTTPLSPVVRLSTKPGPCDGPAEERRLRIELGDAPAEALDPRRQVLREFFDPAVHRCRGSDPAVAQDAVGPGCIPPCPRTPAVPRGPGPAPGAPARHLIYPPLSPRQVGRIRCIALAPRPPSGR